MIECKELVGKVIRLCTLFEEGTHGPEIQMEFTDGTTFNVCLKNDISIEAKCMRDDGGQPQVLKDFTSPTLSR